MDQPLHSSRDHRRDYTSSYGGGRYHGGGGGRGRGRGGRGRGRSGGGYHTNARHHHHHHPFGGGGGGYDTNNNRRGGRGRGSARGGGRGGNHSNRFYAEPPLPMDAVAVAQRQMTHMLVRLGNWEETHNMAVMKLRQQQQQQQMESQDQAMKQEEDQGDDAAPNEEQAAAAAMMEQEQPKDPDSATTTKNDASATTALLPQLQDLIQTQYQNVQSLTTVIAKKPQVFLQFQTAARLQLMQQQQAQQQLMASDYATTETTTSTTTTSSTIALDATALAGPLATSLVHVVTAVSPTAVPVYATLVSSLHHATSAAATSEYAGVAQRVMDLSVQTWCAAVDVLCLVPSSAQPPSVARHQYVQALAHAWRRVVAITRFWCAAAAAGIVQVHPPSSSSDHQEEGEDPVPTAVQEIPLSLTGLLRALGQAAVLAADHVAALLLVRLLQLVTPLLQTYRLVSSAWLADHVTAVVHEVQSAAATTRSEYHPGRGSRALLLQTEVAEEQGDMDHDEEDEDEDEDEEDPNRVCDSWQELQQVVNATLQTGMPDNDDDEPTLALWSLKQQPWSVKLSSDQEIQTQDDNADSSKAAGPNVCLAIYPSCQTLTLLLGGHFQSANPDPNQPQLASTSVVLPLDDSNIVGRLPIFGSPGAPQDHEDDDDDEEEEDEEDAGPPNPRLQSYRQNYKALDRVYLADAMRDMLASHQVLVTETGVEKGSLKALAEQIWSLRHVHPSPGMEYCMVEVLLSLICQIPLNGFLLGHSLVSLSRVLVELTKLEPTLFATVLVQAVHTLVEDYMPAFTSRARNNLSRWFALHLIATQYQWPAQYWEHWQPYVAYGWKNSRGAFVKRAMELVLENTSQPEQLMRQHAHLGRNILAPIPEPTLLDQALESLQNEVYERIHSVSEDPTLLLEYICSDEVAESTKPNLPPESSDWWRTKVTGHALVGPLRKYHEKLLESIAQAQESTESAGDMEEDMEDDSDVLASLLETTGRYESLLLGVLNKEKGELEDDVQGEVALLASVYEYSSFSPSTAEAIFRALHQGDAVSSSGIVRWSLGSGPALRWWEWTDLALRLGMRATFVTPSDYGAMDESTDDGPSGFERKVEKIVSFLQPILEMVISQVVEMLQEDGEAAESARKPTPLQVDLVEGAKHVVCLAHVLFFDELWSLWKEIEGDDPVKEMRKAVDSSTVGKQSLLEIVSSSSGESGVKSVQLLRDVLSNL